jgi:hypothetical protein
VITRGPHTGGVRGEAPQRAVRARDVVPEKTASFVPSGQDQIARLTHGDVAGDERPPAVRPGRKLDS